MRITFSPETAGRNALRFEVLCFGPKQPGKPIHRCYCCYYDYIIVLRARFDKKYDVNLTILYYVRHLGRYLGTCSLLISNGAWNGHIFVLLRVFWYVRLKWNVCLQPAVKHSAVDHEPMAIWNVPWNYAIFSLISISYFIIYIIVYVNNRFSWFRWILFFLLNFYTNQSLVNTHNFIEPFYRNYYHRYAQVPRRLTWELLLQFTIRPSW